LDQEYFEEEMQMIKTANVIQEWINEGIQQGVQQGIQQGIQQVVQQGIEQGIQEGIQQSIIEVLEERFGLVPAEVIQLVKQVEPAVLHRLLRKAAKVKSLDTFKEMLEILAP
jgi:flagellar biosynthesis/type III secretory pathway protein FliH